MSSWRDWMVVLAVLLSLAAFGTLAAGPLGWRLGWWHYGHAFRTLLPWGAWVGLAAVAASLLALATAVRGRGAAVAALLAGALAAWMPWQAGNQRGVFPLINDVTTDVASPPAFVAALPVRRADGGSTSAYSPDFAERQRTAYPDITPLHVRLAPAEAFARAAETAAAMPGWRIAVRDAAAGRIEAAEASRWFGFVDDVVIRIVPDGAGSRIDVRSASRHGRGDFGVNAARVRAYLAALRPRLG